MLLDEDESGNKHGQNVRKSFPLADCLIDMSAPDDGTGSLTRYIELLFGQPFHTPTPDEHGMMTAYVSSLRSASMGRQVGAAITTATVEIIATGCNEVPKFGGGLYWHGDQNDHRDHILGHDPNDVLRYRLIGDVIKAFKKQNWLSDAITAREIKDLLQEAISGSDGKTAILQDSEIMNIIEYGRSVHAEMTAITDCARRGVRVQDSAMYTTTFPCHLCARHIVSSGIRRVVYLEPYPKSLVAELYEDSISFNPVVPGKVVFEQFFGIAPRLYAPFFRMKSDARKTTTGQIKPFDLSKGTFCFVEEARQNEAIVAAEKECIKQFNEKMGQL